jgi:hypothetical protein
MPIYFKKFALGERMYLKHGSKLMKWVFCKYTAHGTNSV